MGVPDIKVRFSMYVDRPGVMNRVGAWRHKILSRTGAYGRGVLKKKIRPMLKGTRRERTVIVNGNAYFVPAGGRVIDRTTGRAARTAEAELAREAYRLNKPRTRGEGRPPRRGPTDKLRKFIDFGIDAANGDTVVMGAVPFSSQPELVRAVTVPDLLNAGGGERIGSQLVQYGPRPFVEVSLPPVVRFAKQLILSNPVG